MITISTLILLSMLDVQPPYQYNQRMLADSVKEISVFLKLSTQKMQFVVIKDSLVSKYEARIIVTNRKGRQVGGDFWILEKVFGPKDVPPFLTDTLRVRVSIEAMGFHIKLRDYFGASIYEGSEKLEPIKYISSFLIYPSRTVEQETVLLEFELFNILGKELDSLLITLGGDAANRVTRPIPKDQNDYRDLVYFNLGKIPSADYIMHLDIFAGGKVVDGRKLSFTLRRNFFFENRLYFEKVRQLRYIATAEEMKKLKSLPVAEREAGWKEFWQYKDENPNTEINETMERYMAGIEYAEEHFSHSDRGWESDRGMVYIKNGPPDEIESHPFELHTEAYEIWYYYKLNLKFIFMDLYGTGRYILLTKGGTSI